MITLALHVDYIKVKPVEKAFESAEELNDDLKEVSMEEALVVFLASEVGDSEEVVSAMVKQIQEQMDRINCKNVLVYPYVHLTDNPSNPSLALSLTLKTEEELKKLNYITKRAPFGWYKSFELKVKGHPLSELSKRIGQKEAKEMEVVSESLLRYVIHCRTRGRINRLSRWLHVAIGAIRSLHPFRRGPSGISKERSG